MSSVDQNPARVLFVFSQSDVAGLQEAVHVARALAGDRFAFTAIVCGDKFVEPAAIHGGLRVSWHSVSDAPGTPVRTLSRTDIVVARQEAQQLAQAFRAVAHVPPVIELPPMPRLRLAAEKGAPWAASDFAMRWADLFDAALAGHSAAMRPSIFRTVWQGGFECSTHRRRDGVRLDVIDAVGHDLFAEADYRQLAAFGMRTVRDGVRWHLVEPAPGRYDFRSVTPMRDAAARQSTQVIWDLMHYGWPDDLDIWSPQFVDRFARYAAAVGRHMREGSDDVPFWCPVNEIFVLCLGGVAMWAT